jgi:hypothetical protein
MKKKTIKNIKIFFEWYPITIIIPVMLILILLGAARII